MGRNTPSLRMEIESIIEEIRKAEKLMSSGNKEIIEDFIRKVKLHIPEGSITSLDPYFVFLLFVLLEIRKEIE
ncbi:MAG: hypothetical protein AMDU3_IPLC00003G0138 [Thermoplasmatales archaeon I-plasma]|nr:MAG: hypothetical protein AMDU3_IPLC00003G0138 [Thermoplasmatales archaeon I-plasma]